MMDLSIIIPVGKREDDFKLIKQIKEKFKGCEIILIADKTNEFIKRERMEVDQFSFLNHSSRARALNEGARISTRNYLWFLHLDSNVKNIHSADLMGLGEFELATFLLQFDQANCWWIEAGANFRTKAFGIPFGDQSFLISKKLFNFIGKFNEQLLEGEDHEFIWRMKSLNVKLNIVNKNIITSAKKYLNRRMIQTLRNLVKTIIQAIKFYKKKKSIVVATFLKDPSSNESKSRLRKELNDEFVNILNKKLLNITHQNLKRLNFKNKFHFVKVCKHNDEASLNSLITIHQGTFINQDQALSLIMSEVSELGLKTIGKVAILGSDIPSLNTDDLNKAFSNTLTNRSLFFATEDGGFCFMLTKDKNVVQCLSKIKSSTSLVMQTLMNCLGSIDLFEKIYTDVDVNLDLKKAYEQLKLNEAHLTHTQKDLLNFLRTNEKDFI